MDSKDLSNLEGFMILRAVYRCAGKKKAAEEYGISVDTLNKYIAVFERNLGIKLVNEKGRNCSLTPGGARVVESLEKIVDICDKFGYEKGNRKDASGKVRVGIDISASSTIIPENAMSFFDAYPQLELEIVPMIDVNKECKDCDVCLSRLPIENTTDLALIYKKELPCGYFASSKYLAKHGYPVDLEDMAKNHRLVSRYNTKIYSETFQKVLKKSSRVCMISSCSAAVVGLTRFGAGIGLLPLRFKDEGLVCLDNIPCDTRVAFYLSAKNKLKDIPRVRAVLDFYKDILAAV